MIEMIFKELRPILIYCCICISRTGKREAIAKICCWSLFICWKRWM